MQVKKQQLELDVKRQTGSKLGRSTSRLYISSCLLNVHAEFSSVQSLSCVQHTQSHVHRVGDAIQPSHPLCPLLLPPSIFPRIRVFSNESVLCIKGPKYWSFSVSISPSNKYSGLISFTIDWFDLLAVPGTLKSLIQHHS